MTEIAEKITLRLPKRFLRALDFLVEMDDFPSRSEAVRAAIRDLVYARVELSSLSSRPRASSGDRRSCPRSRP